MHDESPAALTALSLRRFSCCNAPRCHAGCGREKSSRPANTPRSPRPAHGTRGERKAGFRARPPGRHPVYSATARARPVGHQPNLHSGKHLSPAGSPHPLSSTCKAAVPLSGAPANPEPRPARRPSVKIRADQRLKKPHFSAFFPLAANPDSVLLLP